MRPSCLSLSSTLQQSARTDPAPSSLLPPALDSTRLARSTTRAKPSSPPSRRAGRASRAVRRVPLSLSLSLSPSRRSLRALELTRFMRTLGRRSGRVARERGRVDGAVQRDAVRDRARRERGRAHRSRASERRLPARSARSTRPLAPAEVHRYSPSLPTAHTLTPPRPRPRPRRRRRTRRARAASAARRAPSRRPLR